ncbi:hydantoinase/oxoprolinase family protein [Gemmobacter sp.]|uniref:hydantoinase/oxoprolinase family protein n=1 Tax=Gemmobacter sp. TaxID=1898957 RepID=UPI002AFEA19F|nr:hydantoinase/oxoprolinase family protein [Gemmobacter sp.]
MGYRVGVDIGGTFTDLCALDESTGALHTMKVFSRPDQPGADVAEGIRMLHERYGIAPRDITHFTHGTTVGINAIIQRRGINLALVTTENFCDVLEVARLKMPDPYDLLSRRADPLIPRNMVVGLRERILSDGSVDVPLIENEMAGTLAKARALGAEGLVISLLHSYRNPTHEFAMRDYVRKHAPDIPVFCSYEVWPIIREYERTITAVLHGYVQPRVSFYIDALMKALIDSGVPASPMLTKSNGGLMRAEAGKKDCAQMLLSGTASGVVGAARIAAQTGLGNVMSVDIGGTSADVALIRNGTPC